MSPSGQPLAGAICTVGISVSVGCGNVGLGPSETCSGSLEESPQPASDRLTSSARADLKVTADPPAEGPLGQNRVARFRFRGTMPRAGGWPGVMHDQLILAILMYGLFPLWLLAGLADYLCHRV